MITIVKKCKKIKLDGCIVYHLKRLTLWHEIIQNRIKHFKSRNKIIKYCLKINTIPVYELLSKP